MERLLPNEYEILIHLIAEIRRVYRMHGFLPILSPSIQPLEKLKGKFDSESFELYELRAKGKSNHHAMRFDLTVPLGGYIADNWKDLTFPLRCHQIQKVWRKYPDDSSRDHEFYQCDIDIIGSQTLPLEADAEIPVVILDALKTLNVGEVQMHISNTRIWEGVLQVLGIQKKINDALVHLVQKVDQMGTEYFTQEAIKLGLDPTVVKTLVDFMALRESRLGTKPAVQALFGKDNEILNAGLDELLTVCATAARLGFGDIAQVIDFKLIRDMRYYTGIVYEFYIKHQDIGCIGYGGRYEDLIGGGGSGKFPGVGASLDVPKIFSKVLKPRGDLSLHDNRLCAFIIEGNDEKNLITPYASILRGLGILTILDLSEKNSTGDKVIIARAMSCSHVVIRNANEKGETVLLDLRSHRKWHFPKGTDQRKIGESIILEG